MPPLVHSQPSTTTLDEGHVLLTSFNSFLAVAIHNILFYRNIYPPETFLSAKAYNLPVHQNRHPKVCSWINDAVAAVAAQLAGGAVSRVAVVIHSPLHTIYPLLPSSPSSSQKSNKPDEHDDDDDDFSMPPLSSSSSGHNKNNTPLSQQQQNGHPPQRRLPIGSSNSTSDNPVSNIPAGSVLERWMFDVSRFPAWPGGAKRMKDFERVLANEAKREESRDRPGSASIHAAASSGGGSVRWPDVDEQLRGALRRMTYAAEKMGPLPEGCTFTVAVELREEGAAVPIGYPQAWIPSEPNLQPASKSRSEPGNDLGGAKTTPIRSVEAGPLYFECWVEEGKVKEGLVGLPKSSTQDPP